MNITAIQNYNSGQLLNIKNLHKKHLCFLFHMKKIDNIMSKRTQTPTTISTTSAVFDSSSAPAI